MIRQRVNLATPARTAMVQKAPAGSHAYHIFHFKSSPWCVEQLDTPGCMGTVPRQESVSNCSMHPREFLKWHDRFALFACGRPDFKEYDTTPREYFSQEDFLYHSRGGTYGHIHTLQGLAGGIAGAPPHAGSEPAAYKRRTDVDSIVPTAYRDFTSAVQIYYCKIVLCMDGFLEIHLLVYLRKRTICLRKISFLLIQNLITWHRNL